MAKYTCDKCKFKIGTLAAYPVYSYSKEKIVILCARCKKEHERAMRKADERFFEEVGNENSN